MVATKLTPLVSTCPAGHTLIPTPRNYNCDICQRTSPSEVRSVSYCCAVCDYDVCPTHVHPSSFLSEAPLPFQWRFASAVCPKHHLLQLSVRQTPWNCDVCASHHSMEHPSAFCQQCDYDKCLSHVTAAAPTVVPPPTTTTVDRGLSGASAASLAAVQQALDTVAGPRGFRCVPVSWEDAQRGTVGGALSCWGGNISDVRLWERGGRMLYTLRSNNWNERLGYVSSKGVAIMIGNEKAGAPLTAVTLQSYLRNIGQHAAYAGVETDSLYDDSVDQLLTIRFQTVFLPVAATELAKTEFCTEVYNYNTRADDDPRNLLLLATPQGTSVQQDGQAAKKVFFHQVDEAGAAKRYWLEAERSSEGVGGEQKESAESAAAAWARGKSVAVRIGTEAMGTRFNVQMLIQLPLQQKPRPVQRFSSGAGGFGGGGFGSGASPCSGAFGAAPQCAPMAMPDATLECCFMAPPPSAAFGVSLPSKKRMQAPQAIGVSNAARVSRGTLEDVYRGVANRQMKRDASQHGTITVTMYYTVAGGVPSAADVKSAVDDLDALYKACPSDKRLVDCTEVTAELTVKVANDIGTKVATQPYQPTVGMPQDHGFPQ